MNVWSSLRHPFRCFHIKDEQRFLLGLHEFIFVLHANTFTVSRSGVMCCCHKLELCHNICDECFTLYFYTPAYDCVLPNVLWWLNLVLLFDWRGAQTWCQSWLWSQVITLLSLMESSPAFISIPAALVSFLSNLCLTKIYCIFSLIISVITGIIIQYVYILICLGNIQQFTETRTFKLSSCTRPHVILPLHIKKMFWEMFVCFLSTQWKSIVSNVD